MINLIKKLFTDDWKLVRTYKTNWVSFQTYDGNPVKNTEQDRTTLYNIYYSKIKNKFKLNSDGGHNKSTQDTYNKALRKLTEMNSQLISGVDIKEILKVTSKKDIDNYLKDKYNKDFSKSTFIEPFIFASSKVSLSKTFTKYKFFSFLSSFNKIFVLFLKKYLYPKIPKNKKTIKKNIFLKFILKSQYKIIILFYKTKPTTPWS